MEQHEVITLSDDVELTVKEARRALEILSNKLTVQDRHADNFILAPAARQFLELLLLRYEQDKIQLSLMAAAGQIQNQQEFMARATEANTSAEILRYLLAVADTSAANSVKTPNKDSGE